MTRSQLRRARAPEDKSERRAAIVAAADALIHRSRSTACAVGEIARRAGLAKGTVYLYFGSREEILLAVHDAQLAELFGALEATLARPGADAGRVARAVLAFLRRHPEFFRLATICHGALEGSVAAPVACAHREAVAGRLTALGARIEAVHPGMRPGGGLTLLKNCYALMLGLWQIAASPLRLAGGTGTPAALRIDYETQLAAALTDLWNAAVRRGKGIDP